MTELQKIVVYHLPIKNENWGVNIKQYKNCENIRFVDAESDFSENHLFMWMTKPELIKMLRNLADTLEETELK